MDAMTEPGTSRWGWLHRRTTRREWLALILLSLLAPPLALLISACLASQRWKIGHEWLAWGTLIGFSAAMTVLMVSVLANGGTVYGHGF